MEPENINQEEVRVEQKSALHQVTPLSKYLALALFVILPFLGGWIGYTYAPEKVVEVEKVVAKEVVVEKEVEVPAQVQNISTAELPFGSIKNAKKYLDGTSGLSDEILNRQYPSDMLVDNVGPSLPGERYSALTVAGHDALNDCWITKDNRVYDITELLPLKTLFAALDELENMCGKNITELVEGKPVSPDSLNTARFGYPLAEFFIGAIE